MYNTKLSTILPDGIHECKVKGLRQVKDKYDNDQLEITFASGSSTIRLWLSLTTRHLQRGVSAGLLEVRNGDTYTLAEEQYKERVYSVRIDARKVSTCKLITNGGATNGKAT